MSVGRSATWIDHSTDDTRLVTNLEQHEQINEIDAEHQDAAASSSRSAERT